MQKRLISILLASYSSASLASGYLSLNYGSYNPALDSAVRYSDVEEISGASYQRIDGRYDFDSWPIPALEFSYQQADSYSDSSLSGAGDSAVDSLDDVSALLLYLGSGEQRPRITLATEDFTALYQVNQSDRISNSRGEALQRNDYFTLNRSSQKIGLTWGQDQRLNLMHPNKDWMLTLSYIETEMDYVLFSDSPTLSGFDKQGTIKRDTFAAVGLDVNFQYYSGLGQSNWFATVGPDISLSLGEISGLKGGYFSAVGYKAQAVAFSGMLTLLGSVLDVSQARIKTEVNETAERLEHSGLSYEVFVKLRYDF